MKDNLMLQSAPHVRQSETVFTIMTDVIIALVPLYIMSFFYYGARAIVLGLCGAAFSVLFSLLVKLISRDKLNTRDLTPVITGLIIPLLLPADIPYYVIISACAVAILVVKFPFGGTGNNLFNPAAVGFSAVALCWPELVFKYPTVMQNLSIFGANAAKTSASPAYSLAMGAVPDYDILDLLLGSCSGPMGAANVLVIVACGVFLIVRKAVNWRTPVFFLLTCAFFAGVFPRISGSGFDSMCYELFSGTLVFGAFFMLSEPVTSPKRDFAKILYSVCSAIVVFLFRYFGGFEDGFMFALIIMNVFSPLYDRLCENALHLYRHRDQLERSFAEEGEAMKQKRHEKAPVVRPVNKHPEETPAPEPTADKEKEEVLQ